MKKLFIDCDGCLTDGCLTIDHRGEKMFKRFHTKDVRAIRELVYNGWEVHIVSADDWSGVDYFCDKVGAVFICSKDKSEIECEHSVAVGDDVWDIKMLEKAKTKFCPSDADPVVKSIKGIKTLKTAGGRGIISELIGYLL